MKEKGKNSKSELPEFIRYVRGEMTKKEEHAFQRKLQKDPFADEASEGLEGIDPRLAEKDIQRLGKQLKKRTINKQKVLWYRIAASVAVLMILSSIFIIINKNKPTEQIAYSPPPTPDQEIQAAPEQKKAMPIAEIEKTAPPVPEKSKEVTDTIQIPVNETAEKNELKEEVISTGEQDAAMAAKGEEPVNLVAAGRAMATKSILVKEAGYIEYATEDTAVNYTPPLPVNGRDSFDIYIRDNIRRPDTTTAGQSVVVVLDFLITSDGKIDSINVVRSPGKIYSDEAIRVIKEGPAWKPAVKNGKAVDDQVRITIAFK
jgi:TonB family protein